MAGSNFQALATRIAAAKGPGFQKAMSAAGYPRASGLAVRLPSHGRSGSNAGPRGGLYGITSMPPGYKGNEPRSGRPKVGGRAPRYQYPSGSRPRV